MIIEGYAARFNNVDDGGDLIKPKAFLPLIPLGSKSNKFPLLWNHDDSNLIGTVETLKVNRRGLYITAHLNSELNLFTDTVKRYLQSDIQVGISIGYRIFKSSTQENSIGELRKLESIRLLEISLTLLPMNTECLVKKIKRRKPNGRKKDNIR